MTAERENARLAVSRHAARLFLERGVGGTSGDDIAAAAGLSKRTVWRYFRSKESCVEPLLSASSLRFSAKLRQWPRNISIETHLAHCFDLTQQTPEEISDGVLIVHLIALLPQEPGLRAAWLMACHEGEQDMIEIISERLDRSVNDFEVRLCAATVVAAMRVVDETISTAAVKHGQAFTSAGVVEEVSRAIRAASTLPFCDPVVPQPFGRK